MSKTPRTFKQLAAGTAAIVLTFAAAGAAVAVNLGTSSSGQGSKVGNLPAAQPISAAGASSNTVPVVPSTIYVDVTVPYDVPTPPPSQSAPSQSAPSRSSASQRSSAPTGSSVSPPGDEYDGANPNGRDDDD